MEYKSDGIHENCKKCIYLRKLPRWEIFKITKSIMEKFYCMNALQNFFKDIMFAW